MSLSLQYFSGNPLDRSFGNLSTKIVNVKSVLCLKVQNGFELHYLNKHQVFQFLDIESIEDLIEKYTVILLGCYYDDYKNPIWVVIVDVLNNTIDNLKDKVHDSIQQRDVNFESGRNLLTKMNKIDLAIAGQAISIATWHDNNKFSGISGLITTPTECGMKRQSSDGSKIYPRIDPVIIATVVSPDKKMCLLGHMKRMPTNFFSCLSGFIEPCESIDEAVRREVWEEAGIRIGQVSIITSQPWPIGKGGSCELMIGCHAIAKTVEINIQDNEVDEVRWFTYEEAKSMVEKSLTMTSIRDSSSPYVPGPYAIAHHLVKKFVDDYEKEFSNVNSDLCKKNWNKYYKFSFLYSTLFVCIGLYCYKLSRNNSKI